MDIAQNVMATAGLYTPTSRFVGVGAAVALGLWYFKPGMFYIGGRARPWSLLEGGPASTIVPPWLAAVGSGAFAGTML